MDADSGQQASRPTCFGTFAEAIRFATNGRINLPAGATTVPSEQVEAYNTRAAEEPGVNVVIGISWEHAGYTGASWTHNAAYGCDDSADVDWYINWVGSTWNDRISSARAYSNCLGVYYQHINRTGSYVFTPWSGGAMNDQTSSIEWR